MADGRRDAQDLVPILSDQAGVDAARQKLGEWAVVLLGAADGEQPLPSVST